MLSAVLILPSIFLSLSSAVQGSRQATGVNRFGFFYFLVNLAENMEVEKVVSAWSRLLKLAGELLALDGK